MRIDPPKTTAAPDFAHAKTKRQKQRAAGLHPDYWYPAEWSKDLKVLDKKEVIFWKRSIVIFRGADGKVRALENRCAHRQLKLSRGTVEGCNLACSYHGWVYEESGKVVEIKHSLFGHKMPQVEVAAFPVMEKYGIIWIFPGDPEVAKTREVPEIPEWNASSGWSTISIDFTWKAHHSIIIDNTCDFTHAYLHRVRKPFTHAELTSLAAKDDAVDLTYDTKVGQGRFQKLLVNQKTTNTNAMTLGYAYPYQWSSTDDKIKHWCYVLPIDERTTRTFFLFYFHPDMMKIPLLGLHAPQGLLKAIMPLAKRWMVRPLLDEDGVAVEAEQQGYEQHFDKPVPDLNPVVHAFQALTIKKWEQYLATLAPSSRAVLDQQAAGE